MNGSTEGIGEFIHELGEAARKNPISAALIGAGAVWLVAGRAERGTEVFRWAGIDRLPRAARDAWEGTSSGLTYGVRTVGDTLSETNDALQRGSGQAMDRMANIGERLVRDAADYAEELPNQAGRLLEDARDSLTDVFKAQPLMIGAVGLAIGAAIAAALPRTEAEDEYLGESSEFVKHTVGEIAGEQAERASQIGKKVLEAVADEAQKQGLTAEGLKSAATDLSKKASRVADAATRSRP